MPRNEAQTRFEFINPALFAKGWTTEHIKVEESTGGIVTSNGKARRRKGRTDYLLRLIVSKDTQPIAVALIEAKAEDKSPSSGLMQGQRDGECDRLNVKFIFSTNGHQFVEYDKFNGIISSPKQMSEFPSHDELKKRYEKGMKFTLNSEAAKPLLAKYSGGESQRRYYQDAAIRAIFEAVAQGKTKALLSIATGAGKTFIAVNMLRRVADAGLLKKALFICDRDELRNQALTAFSGAFGSNAAPVENNNPQKNARVIIATYQSLGISAEEDDASFLIQNYPENYFSHIVIDECHRSAWGKWSLVLKRNEKAIQIGLTATPRSLMANKNSNEDKSDYEITADNLKYFGEPVYEYTMLQAIEDGYLAACEIQKSTVNLDDTGISLEELLKHNLKNAITGQPITTIEELKEIYEKTDYESRLMLPDRIAVMCKDFFYSLVKTGTVEQKSIIFCVRDMHAELVSAELNNLYNSYCKLADRKHLNNFAFKCTSESGGSELIADMRGSNTSYFIATTVDLLSTGVDIPAVRNIVFFRYVKSPISFQQMVGRGTRLADNKMMFTIYDYTDATRLFGNQLISKPRPPKSDGGGGGEPPIIIQAEGFEVEVTPTGQFVVSEVDGQIKRITIEDYKKGIAEKLLANAHSFDEFVKKWITQSVRSVMLSELVQSGYSGEIIRQVNGLDEYDLFDVLIEIAYGKTPVKKLQRVMDFQTKERTWLNSLSEGAKDVIIAIVNQFAFYGTDSIESSEIFNTYDVKQAGGLKALNQDGNAKELILETKMRLFAA